MSILISRFATDKVLKILMRPSPKSIGQATFITAPLLAEGQQTENNLEDQEDTNSLLPQVGEGEKKMAKTLDMDLPPTLLVMEGEEQQILEHEIVEFDDTLPVEVVISDTRESDSETNTNIQQNMNLEDEVSREKQTVNAENSGRGRGAVDSSLPRTSQ